MTNTINKTAKKKKMANTIHITAKRQNAISVAIITKKAIGIRSIKASGITRKGYYYSSIKKLTEIRINSNWIKMLRKKLNSSIQKLNLHSYFNKSKARF